MVADDYYYELKYVNSATEVSKGFSYTEFIKEE